MWGLVGEKGGGVVRWVRREGCGLMGEKGGGCGLVGEKGGRVWCS